MTTVDLWVAGLEEVWMTLAMAVSLGWGVLVLELVLLGWLLARHNR